MAARCNAPAPPVDTRYLSRPFQKIGEQQCAQTRGDIVSFLECIYESIAETLPDFRDELGSASGVVISLDDPCAAEMEAQIQASRKRTADQALADVDLRPASKYSKSRQIKVNLDRANSFEERWLPPGTMTEYYEQYKLQSGLPKPGSFKSFWRVAGLIFHTAHCFSPETFSLDILQIFKSIPCHTPTHFLETFFWKLRLG